MAETASRMKLGTALQGMSSLSILRQMGLMIGLAASVALGVAVVLWSQEPSYRMLYSGLADQDAMEVTGALDRSGIPYKVTAATGTIMVPENRIHEARLNLAGQGLPKGTATGFALLDKEQGFGVSQFMENARYQRALEEELAKTISSMSNVHNARVHLAIPKQSAFVRDRKDPSASVMVNLAGGRNLQSEQVMAIVHLVASSVPSLGPEQVTVVDQSGKLLTSQQSSEQLRLTANQFEYRRQMEDYYIKRIEDILTPILGPSGVRAQVSADIDFNMVEQTQESFNPDLPAVRSEQTFEDRNGGANAAAGVPGALSNQPPGVAAAKPAQGQVQTEASQNSVKRVTRNYELDKTISHTQFQTGIMRRLSIAVVVDDQQKTNEDGTVEHTPRTEEQLTRITSLVREAVGFNEQRGDSVNVINASFAPPPVEEPPPAQSFLEKPWIWDVAKQLAAGVGVLLLIFMVLRPVLRGLVEKAPAVAAMAQPGMGELPMPANMAVAGQQMQNQLAAPNQYDQQLGAVKGMAAQDPKRVAQVVKNWVSTEG